MIGYVLVRVEQEKRPDVQKALRAWSSTKEIHALVGEWDLIVKIEREGPIDGAHVLFDVAAIQGVKETRWLGVSRIGSAETHSTHRVGEEVPLEAQITH